MRLGQGAVWLNDVVWVNLIFGFKSVTNSTQSNSAVGAAGLAHAVTGCFCGSVVLGFLKVAGPWFLVLESSICDVLFRSHVKRMLQSHQTGVQTWNCSLVTHDVKFLKLSESQFPYQKNGSESTCLQKALLRKLKLTIYLNIIWDVAYS